MAKTFMHDLLNLAVESGASDLHIKLNHPVALRISGKLVDSDFIADDGFMSKTLELMTTADQLSHYRKCGDVDLSYVEEDVGRFRVNIHTQRGGPAITMRHVKSTILAFEKLGLPPIVKQIAEAERGIVFITGTTGSGKSTTLASMLDHVNRNMRKHIITIEDPVEYEFADRNSFIEQREVGLDTESFDSALIHAIRQDPDIIMIGEMRNRDSFDAALQAADTGHLVMTTLHTTNASQSINRLLDFYESSEHDSIRWALATNLHAIISQRLIPKAVGGGVVPSVEIMINTPIIQKLIFKNKLDKLAPAIENCTGDGMQSFNQSLVNLVNEGIISEDDAMKAATNPESLRMNLQGIFLGSENAILGD